MLRLSRFIGVVAATAAIASCESATAPRGGVQRIEAGSVVSGALAAGDSGRLYAFAVAAGAQYVVYAVASAGAIQLQVMDSGRQNTYSQGYAGLSALPLSENPALQFYATAVAGRLLVVSGYPAGASAQYQLLLYQINNAPESRPAAFVVGDTINGETLDPSNDVDVFTALLQAGQDVVAVAEAPTVSGVGTLELTVRDSSDFSPLSYAFIMPGAPASATTGRVHAATTGTYQFRFQSATGTGWPAFEGPYRFWTYAVNHAPEHRAAAIPFDTAVVDERFDRAMDVDEFTFTAAAGTEINGFLQSAVPAHLEIAPQSAAAIAAVAAGSDTSLFAQSTGRTTLAQAGTYIARVSADGQLTADTGAYRLYVYLINRRPETIPDSIAAGDTVAGESVDLPGDVDEFRFAASAGDEFSAFLQAQSGSAATLLQLDVVDADGTVLGSVQSTGTDSSLLGQVTQRVAMRTTGIHRLRIYGVGASHGPYRLFLYPVNRKPESHADTLALGDSVLTESINVPGDIDEFRVHVPATIGINLLTRLTGSTDWAIAAQVVDSASGDSLAATKAYAGALAQTGAVTLAPGTYIIRVQGAIGSDRSLTRGPYQLWLYAFPAGTAATDTVTIGDTIQGVIPAPGASHTFYFRAARWQPINVMLQGQASGTGTFVGSFHSGPGSPPFAFLYSPASAATLPGQQMVRMDLPTPGWYSVTVGMTSQAVFDARGPYRLAIVPIATAPEAAASTLAIGDSVSGETIGFPGDWDQYAVTATPGQEFDILLTTDSSSTMYPTLWAFDPSTGDTLALAGGPGTHLAGPIQVPASGRVTLAVAQPISPFGLRECADATCGGLFQTAGPYSLSLLPFSRAPETVPAGYAIGDTVSTESIWPIGDIDEFTTTASPGDTLTAWFRLRADPLPTGDRIGFSVWDAATGSAILGTTLGQSPAWTSYLFVVPSSGQLLIRVQSYVDSLGTAPYEFFLRRGY